MIVKHLNEIDSTQNYLINLLKDNDSFGGKNILISTNNQTSGRGRGENSWLHQTHALAFSFTLKPLEILTLTSLEAAVNVCKFLNKGQVKWPNDILNFNKQKVGGILINIIDGVAVVGVGINLSNSANDVYPGIDLELSENYKEVLPIKIYEYFLNNRIFSELVANEWNKLCAHLNSKVTLIENEKKMIGTFKKIGPHGEAQININGELKSFYNGSLVI
jgi:BirA family transcriptional regulator, biotin operon repressor / biotin---[acetyl-CoA-carboxylase] ligase